MEVFNRSFVLRTKFPDFERKMDIKMERTEFEALKQSFLLYYQQARPAMTIMGDEVRQTIVLTLIEAGGSGGIRVGEIQKRASVSRSAVSHHLKVLLDAGIIAMRREGTRNYYYMDSNSSGIRAMIEFWEKAAVMMENCSRYHTGKERE